MDPPYREVVSTPLGSLQCLFDFDYFEIQHCLNDSRQSSYIVTRGTYAGGGQEAQLPPLPSSMEGPEISFILNSFHPFYIVNGDFPAL